MSEFSPQLNAKNAKNACPCCAGISEKVSGTGQTGFWEESYEKESFDLLINYKYSGAL